MENNALSNLEAELKASTNVNNANAKFEPMNIYSGSILSGIVDAFGGDVKGSTYTKHRSDGSTDTGKRLVIEIKTVIKMRGKEIHGKQVATIDISKKVEFDPDYVKDHLDEFYVAQPISVDPRFDLVKGEDNDKLVNLTIVSFQEAEEIKQASKSAK